MQKILITGAAGFIGFHLTKKLQNTGDYQILGLDNLNNYYDPQLKLARLQTLGFNTTNIVYGKTIRSINGNTRFIKLDLENPLLTTIFRKNKFDFVINLAAQAGVRYSLINSQAYINSNIVGFANLLEACRNYPPTHLLYASSSSVYGLNKKVPFAENDITDSPASLYAATKKSNELMAHAYSHLFGLPCIGLRFFTVYGPFGRPDMAYYDFTSKIMTGRPITLFNRGNLYRDFTYIDDVITAIMSLIIEKPKESDARVRHQVYNIGNDHPTKVSEFVRMLEKMLKRKSLKKFIPMQAGDIPVTHANITKLNCLNGWRPKTDLKSGLQKFVSWWFDYHQISSAAPNMDS